MLIMIRQIIGVLLNMLHRTKTWADLEAELGRQLNIRVYDSDM